MCSECRGGRGQRSVLTRSASPAKYTQNIQLMCPWWGPCLLLLSLWAPVRPYANGRVSKSCSSMEPNHHSPGQRGPAPYALQTNSSSYSPGDRVEVTLSGPGFKGFLLQARDPDGDPSTVGTFSLTDPHATQLLTCHKHQGSAVSHTSSSQKHEVRVIWKAPGDPPHRVQFLVTVVSQYDVFWLKIEGPIISQHGATPRPPKPTPSSVPPPEPTSSVLPGPFSSEGCGLSKWCLLDPPGCDPSHDPLCFYLSATAQGPSQQQGPPQQQTMAFELSGPAEGYVALALSRDTWMGDDDVYLCINIDGRVSVEAAVVRGRSHPEEQTQSDLHSVSWRISDGIIQCRFSRSVKPANQERFDLEQDYFLFVASGPAHRGQIWRHPQQPLVSALRVRLTDTPLCLHGSRGPTLLKVHGALMLLAWMLAGSIGTIVASFYKNEWTSQTLCGQKVWFQVHRALMVVTVSLTLVGFWLPFAYRGGWSKRAGVHPYLGCCVLALSLIQPITASLRPPPDSPRRWIFSWCHWGLGSLTEAMAVAAMFLGVGQSSLPLPSSFATHVLIGYVSWIVAFRLLLLIHKHFYTTKLKVDDQSCIVSDQSEARIKRSWFKVLVLFLVLVGNLGLLSVLMVSITQL